MTTPPQPLTFGQALRAARQAAGLSLWKLSAFLDVDLEPFVGVTLSPQAVMFGRGLRARLAAGLTQAQLTDKAGVGRSLIAHLELGLRKPSEATVRELAAALGVELTKLLNPPAEVRPAEDLAALAKRINKAHKAAERATDGGLEHQREAGKALLAAKELCRYGEWLRWLRKNIRCKTSLVYQYMELVKPQSKDQRRRLLSRAQALVEQMGGSEEAELLEWLQQRREQAKE